MKGWSVRVTMILVALSTVVWKVHAIGMEMRLMSC